MAAPSTLTKSQTSRTGLLSLPPKIREMIRNFVILRPKPIPDQRLRLPIVTKEADQKALEAEIQPPLALSGVNKGINLEATPIFFSTNAFMLACELWTLGIACVTTKSSLQAS